MHLFINIVKIAAIALAFFIVSAGIKKLIAEPAFSRIFSKSNYKLPQGIFIISVQLLLYFMICKYILKAQFIEGDFFVSIAIGMGIGILLIGISIILLRLLGAYTFKKNEEYVNSNKFNNFITIFIFFLVLALFEEIVFRGIIYTGVRSEFSMMETVIIVTVVFVIPHLFNKGINILSVASLILAGLFMNILREYSGNIWMPLGFHFVWNFVQGFIGFNVSGGNEMIPRYKVEKHGREYLHGGEFGVEASLVTILILAMGFTAMLLVWI